MNSKKQCLLKLFLCLFTVSVAMTVIPGTFLYSYGLLGEVTTISVSETGTDYIVTPRPKHQQSIKKDAVKQSFNLWLILFVAILVLIYTSYILKLPCYKTIVTLKIRMDC